MIVYKKVRLKSDGKCYPLFIDRQKPFEFGEWMHCKYVPTKGFMPRSITGMENPIGGWHSCFLPIAPHISDQLASGEKRVWMECEAKGETATYDRPESQGGTWCLVEWIKPIRILTDEDVQNIIKEA